MEAIVRVALQRFGTLHACFVGAAWVESSLTLVAVVCTLP